MSYFENVREQEWKAVKVSDDFRWVLLVIVLQIFQYFFCVVLAGKPRGVLFTEQFMNDNFKEEHEKAGFGQVQKGGYPDSGDGIYTIKAGYKAWFDFNNAQRQHINYLESITQMMTQQLIVGVYWPMPTFIIGIIYLIGRILFTFGYIKKGPKGR